MIHNLTEKQLQALRWIMKQVEDDVLQESFIVISSATLASPDAILISGIEDLPDYINAGALDALSITRILASNRTPGGATRYTLTGEAYRVAAFDFNNPEPDPINFYMRETYYLIQKHFNREELERACFELGFQPDWVFGDKTDWPLHLLLYLYRQNRLGDLPPVLEKLRPGIDWLPYPGNETAVN